MNYYQSGKIIDVVYVLYNNYSELENSLLSLKNFINKTNFRINIFIIDNSSNQIDLKKSKHIRGFVQQISESNIFCHYYSSKYNMGFSKGCNYGAKLGSAEIILFVNCDTDFSDFTNLDFENHLDLIYKNKGKVGITGPKVLNSNGLEEPSCFSFDPFAILLKPLRHLEKISRIYKFIPKFKFIKNALRDLTYDGFYKNKLVEVDWISGCCMFVSRKLFEVTNGFDERYFLYFDDVDICRNARLNNYKVIFDPRLIIRHFAKHQSASYKSIYKSLIFNRTSRFHITSWFLYLIKWRNDMFYKIVGSKKNFFKMGRYQNKKNFSVYKVFKQEKI